MANSEQLEIKVKEIESYFPDREVVVDSISKASVGWQLDHSLKVLNVVFDMLKNSKTEDYKWKFNFWRSYCFLINGFPRGRAKAPKSVRPLDIISLDGLNKQLQEARENLATIDDLPSKTNITHHIFGSLNKKQTIRFLNIHTEHHLKIVRDILKANKKP